MSNQSNELKLLQQLKEELSLIQIEPFPVLPWTKVQAWVAKTKPIINMYFPLFSNEFNEITKEPKYRLSAGTVGNKLAMTHWNQKKSATEGKIKEFTNFIDGIILASSMTSTNGSDNSSDSEIINRHSLDLTTLNKLLIDAFDLQDLKNLCFDLGIEYDTLAHQTRSELSRELINYMKQQKQILKLIVIIVQLRPKTNWSQIEENNG